MITSRRVIVQADEVEKILLEWCKERFGKAPNSPFNFSYNDRESRIISVEFVLDIINEKII